MSTISQEVSDQCRVFLEHDFNDRRKILAVKSNKELVEVNWAELSLWEKRHYDRTLDAIVEFVNKHFLEPAKNSQAESGTHKLWEVHFGYLEEQVEIANKDYFFSKIVFENPLKKSIQFEIIVPIVPDSFREPFEYNTFKTIIYYTPLTKVTVIEDQLKKYLEHYNTLILDKRCDYADFQELNDKTVSFERWIEKTKKDKIIAYFINIEVRKFFNLISKLELKVFGSSLTPYSSNLTLLAESPEKDLLIKMKQLHFPSSRG